MLPSLEDWGSTIYHEYGWLLCFGRLSTSSKVWYTMSLWIHAVKSPFLCCLRVTPTSPLGFNLPSLGRDGSV